MELWSEDLTAERNAPSKPYMTDEWEPTDPRLWLRVLNIAKGRRRQMTRVGPKGPRTIHAPNKGRGFRHWPNQKAVAWAVKQYNGYGGRWKGRDEKAVTASDEGLSLYDHITILKRMVDARTHKLEDVVEGHVPVGVEGASGMDILLAKQLGLFTCNVAGVDIFARCEDDARPLIHYLERGGTYGSLEFSKLLGYDEEEIELYRCYLLLSAEAPQPENLNEYQKATLSQLRLGSLLTTNDESNETVWMTALERRGYVQLVDVNVARGEAYWDSTENGAQFATKLAEARNREAKGVSLLPEYKQALEELKEGDPEPLRSFARKALKVIFPNEDFKPADWFHGLGTSKRNAINSLQKELNVYLMEASSLKAHPALIPSKVLRAASWAKSLRTLEIASVAMEVTEMQRGPFTVVAMPGVSLSNVEGSLEALDEATARIRSKFPKVLYGKVFLTNHLKRNIAAWYVAAEDKFYLDVRAKKRFNDVYTIVHELGHRHDHKFLSKASKTKFWNLSTRKVYEKLVYDDKLRGQVAQEAVDLAKARALGQPVPGLSPELQAWLRSVDGPQDAKQQISLFLEGKIDEKKLHQEIKGTKDVEVTTDRVLHGPLSVTAYGATKVTENYAEAFAHFVLDKDMPQEFVEILSSEQG